MISNILQLTKSKLYMYINQYSVSRCILCQLSHVFHIRNYNTIGYSNSTVATGYTSFSVSTKVYITDFLELLPAK